jgi:hypothetical protein
MDVRQKDKELWKSIQSARWDDVIMNEDKKKALQDDVSSFFANEAVYEEYAIPWKVCYMSHACVPSNQEITIK